MRGPSSSPRGEHTPKPGVLWTTTVGWSGEEVVDDDAEPHRPNRATRRAAKRQRPRKAQEAREGPSAPVSRPNSPQRTRSRPESQTGAHSLESEPPTPRSPE